MVVFKQPSPLNSATVFLASAQFNLNISSDRGVTFTMKYNTHKMGNVMQHGHFLNMLYLFLITILTTCSETFWAFQGPTSLLQPPIPWVWVSFSGVQRPRCGMSKYYTEIFQGLFLGIKQISLLMRKTSSRLSIKMCYCFTILYWNWHPLC